MLSGTFSLESSICFFENSSGFCTVLILLTLGTLVMVGGILMIGPRGKDKNDEEDK